MRNWVTIIFCLCARAVISGFYGGMFGACAGVLLGPGTLWLLQQIPGWWPANHRTAIIVYNLLCDPLLGAFLFAAASLRLPAHGEPDFFIRTVPGLMLGMFSGAVGAVSLIAALSLFAGVVSPLDTELVYAATMVGGIAGFSLGRAWRVSPREPED
jgi:hypothetical protein